MKRSIQEVLKGYCLDVDQEKVSSSINKILNSDFETLYTVENLKRCFSLIDLTTLHCTDTGSRVKLFADNVNRFPGEFDLPNVAAICVYPSQVAAVRESLKTDNVNIASVAGVFPSSQSFIEVKNLECKMAVEKGADEIDVVISVGALLEGDYQRVYDEIVSMREACGSAHLKVILETGELKSLSNIRIASIIAMEAGADFIKTSTGKVNVNATLEAAYVMTQCIKEYQQKSGRIVGFKPAGGISTAKDAIEFFAVTRHNLGEQWLNNKYFRIGASSLANNLLSEIQSIQKGEDVKVSFF